MVLESFMTVKMVLQSWHFWGWVLFLLTILRVFKSFICFISKDLVGV